MAPNFGASSHGIWMQLREKIGGTSVVQNENKCISGCGTLS